MPVLKALSNLPVIYVCYSAIEFNAMFLILIAASWHYLVKKSSCFCYNADQLLFS